MKTLRIHLLSLLACAGAVRADFDLPQALRHLYPQAEFGKDIRLADTGDGKGPRIVGWDAAKLGPQPTKEQIAAAKTAVAEARLVKAAAGQRKRELAGAAFVALKGELAAQGITVATPEELLGRADDVLTAVEQRLATADAAADQKAWRREIERAQRLHLRLTVFLFRQLALAQP
jgi:hypothetical protein